MTKKQLVAFILELIPLYSQVINELVGAGAEWVQLEEPALTQSLSLDEVKIVARNI